MTFPDYFSHNRQKAEQAERKDFKIEKISLELDDFAQKNNLKSLRDRLKRGLNEVGVLAVTEINDNVKKLCELGATAEKSADEIYNDVFNMCLDMQQSGPWGYAKELTKIENPEIKIWYIITSAISKDYTKERDLTENEFLDQVNTINQAIISATSNFDKSFSEAHQHTLDFVNINKIRLESYETKSTKSDRTKGKVPNEVLSANDIKNTLVWDANKYAPIAEGSNGFLAMAMHGCEVGISQDDDGWVYVGGAGEIPDNLIESCGLKKEIAPDPRDPKRSVTFFVNEQGQQVVKKIHPGFLVILSKSFDLAKSITKAFVEKSEIVEVAKESLTHTRVVQTSEAKVDDESFEIEKDSYGKSFLNRGENTFVETSKTSSRKEIISQREKFYQEMLYVRSLYVYLDALRELKSRKNRRGQEVTEEDKLKLMNSISEKMGQKVDELRYVNEIIAKALPEISQNITEVIDMAGGAGDLGLAVANHLLASGHELNRMEVVDPQEGTDRFMDTIITHLPFRKKMEEISYHNNGYLQDAKITKDSMVVAKHACGTLTDDIIEMWKESDSKILVLMTCCQDKACGHPARYGFGQSEWDEVCKDTSWTNIEESEIESAPAHKKEAFIQKANKGREAMTDLDMARVNFLRRHGCRAELFSTTRFPKGDVIVAKKLPINFLEKLADIKKLESQDPVAYDSLLIWLQKLARGGDVKNMRMKEFGGDWENEDFSELLRRIIEQQISPKQKSKNKEDTISAPKAEKLPIKRMITESFREFKGDMGKYVLQKISQFAPKLDPIDTKKQFVLTIKEINQELNNLSDPSPEKIRDKVDEIIINLLPPLD